MSTMQRHKSYFLVILLVCCVVPAFGAFDGRMGASVYGGASFCIPTSSYLTTYPGDASVKMPAFRTSGNFGVDVELVQFRFGGQESAFIAGAGLSYLSVSKSIAYGASVLRPYHGVGAFFQLGGHFNDFFSLTLLFRLAYCLFPSVKQAFLVYDFELVPTFELASFGPVNLYLVTPVTTSIKSDALTLRLSCGLKLDVSFAEILENRGRKDE